MEEPGRHTPVDRRGVGEGDAHVVETVQEPVLGGGVHRERGRQAGRGHLHLEALEVDDAEARAEEARRVHAERVRTARETLHGRFAGLDPAGVRPDGVLAPKEDVEKVGIGTRVRMVFTDIAPGLSLPQWTIDESATQPAKPWRYPQE